MAARKTQTAKKTTRKLTSVKASAKATTKRTPAKKTSARKAVKSAKPAKTVKKAASAKSKSNPKLSLVKTSPISVGNKPFTKGQLVSTISDQTGIMKKEVELVLNAVSKVIHAHLKKQGPESFAWPGLFKIVVAKKPATPEKWGVNPFTKEKMKFKAKPASRRVKIRALKGLKEMVL